MATVSPRIETTASTPLRYLGGADTDGVIYAMSDAEFAAWAESNPPPDMSEPDWHRRQRERRVAAMEAARRSGSVAALVRALRAMAVAEVASAVKNGSDRKFLIRYMDTTAREFFNLMRVVHAAVALVLRGALDAVAGAATVASRAVAATARDVSAAVVARLHGLIHQSLTARIAQVGRGASI